MNLSKSHENVDHKSPTKPTCIQNLSSFLQKLRKANRILTLNVSQLSDLINSKLIEVETLQKEVDDPKSVCRNSRQNIDDLLLNICRTRIPISSEYLSSANDSSMQNKKISRNISKTMNTASNLSHNNHLSNSKKAHPIPYSNRATDMAFQFFSRRVGKTIKREYRARFDQPIGSSGLHSKLLEKWNRMSERERDAWIRASHASS